MAKLNFQKLDENLRHGKLDPVYFITGEENYLIDTSIERIRAAFSHDEELECYSFSGDETSPVAAITHAQTMSLMGGRRFILVREIKKWKEPTALKAYLKNPNPACMLILTSAKIDGRTGLGQMLAKETCVVECKPLYENELPSWIRMKSDELGKKISQEAARFLADVVGSDLSMLAQSLAKLALYTGKEPLIGIKDIETVIADTSQKDVFEMTGAIGSRDLNHALRVLRKLTEFGETPVLTLYFIARHWRLIAKTKEYLFKNRHATDSDVARLLQVNPFFAKDYIVQAKNFTPANIKRGFGVLYQMDKAVKSSKMPKHMVLEKGIRELMER